MEPSIAGVLVVGALLTIVVLLRAPPVVGIFASLPFGATAIGSLTSLGGSTPPIYTVFAALFICSTLMRRDFVRNLCRIFERDWAAWLVLLLIIYVVGTAVLLPHIFMGQTIALVPTDIGVVGRVLAPVSGNITQAAYFTLGALTFFALAVYLASTRDLGAIRLGFFVWASLHAALGFVDFGAKFLGAGDVLETIRTANYSMHTNVEVGGFSRITGVYSEASSFGGASLACLAFMYAYWRKSRSPLALALALASLLLLLLSTSSSAYVTVGILAIPLFVGILYRALIGESETQDFAIMGLMLCCAVVIIGIYVYDERILAPTINLLDETILRKSTSTSALERSYWNQVSLQSFLDTAGFGIGMGSSRASSWPVAVLSQFGVIGALMLAALLSYLARGLRGISLTTSNHNDVAVIAGMRASVLAGLLGATLAGTSADPGLLFFMTIAAISICRARFSRHRSSLQLDRSGNTSFVSQII